MEYWTGDSLSHPITQVHISYFSDKLIIEIMLNFYIYVLIFICTAQENITLSRYKLAGILLCWKTNMAAMITNFEQNHYTEGNPNDVTIMESPDDQKKVKSISNVFLSKMGIHELVGGLCDYIKSINCPETLE